MQTAVECPVNFTLVNQNKIRLVALFVFFLSSLYLLVPHWSIAALLAVDFFFRAFNKGTFRFLGWLSGHLSRMLSLPNKPIDSGLKKFAAQMGFFISDCLFVVAVVGLHEVGVYIAGLLMVFSFMEAAFGFCAGCHVYSFYQKLLRRREVKPA